ncbi:hypothetical protein AB0D38_23475 [Streptomyces sp. NPDC048279]|uniref:hypothetical protein n=1 Tax=Streptomyces sp. NPDC048279 TaxID=3154714 RepID=UPI0034426872
MSVDIQHLFNTALPDAFVQDPDGAKSFKGIYQIAVTGDGGGEWQVNASPTGSKGGGCGQQRAAQNGAPARQSSVVLRRDHGGWLPVNRGSRAGAPGIRLEGTRGGRGSG